MSRKTLGRIYNQNSPSSMRAVQRARNGRPRVRGTVSTLVLALGTISAALATVTVSPPRKSRCRAADPGPPGVLPPVDLNSLEEMPVTQWGVTGIGTSYSDVKAFVWDFAEEQKQHLRGRQFHWRAGKGRHQSDTDPGPVLHRSVRPRQRKVDLHLPADGHIDFTDFYIRRDYIKFTGEFLCKLGSVFKNISDPEF